jgi:protein-tyrosine phosphatase
VPGRVPSTGSVSPAALPERILPMERIQNFRDYGDYPAADGARVRRGVLWRSGQHARATPADLERVAGLGLATVIDLRGDSERQAYPCLRHGDFAADVLYAAGETAAARALAAHEEAAEAILTADDARRAMTSLYQGMAWRPVLVATYRLYFAALAEREGPSLLHCFAGKDRTGLAAALAHHVLGVHPDDAMSDYLLTNVALEAEMRRSGGRIAHQLVERMGEEAAWHLLSVRPEYLTGARQAIVARHGSLDAYLDEVLGVNPERREAIRGKLLV